MQHTRKRRGVLVGIGTTALTLLALNWIIPGNRLAVAQDATPTAIATVEPGAIPTTVPTISLGVNAELTPTGDVSGNGAADPGDTITYTINATNNGDTPVDAVEIALIFDASFIGGTTPLTEGAQLDTGRVSWNLATFEPGAAETFSVAAQLNRRFPPGRSLVQASAVAHVDSVEIARENAPEIEVLGPNVRITDITFDLITDVAQNARIDPGDSIRFTISYANQGGGPSQDISVVADYPDEITEALVNVPEAAQQTEGALVWLVGSIPPGGEVTTVQFTVELASPFPPGVTTYNLHVSIQGASSTLDEQTLSVPIQGPSLLISPRAEFLADTNGNNLADPGDVLRVTLQIANVGNETATNVSIKLSYAPAQVEITSVDQEGSKQSDVGVVSWNIASLDSGATEEVSFEMRLRTITPGNATLQMSTVVTSDQTGESRREVLVALNAPPLTPTPGPTATPSIQQTRPAQGQGILGAYAIALLIGSFLVLSLLSIVYVASRVLPGTVEERETLDTEEERADNRRLVRELLEGVILTAILFSVMILGLQNALDQNSVNSIIAGIVGYVGGRVASSR